MCDSVINDIAHADLLDKSERNRRSLNQPLGSQQSSWVTEGKKNFIVLRRWASYTPLMATDNEHSLGGGYVLVWKGKVVVIDPGSHFVRNFRELGFNINDIHAIVVTHAHVDHVHDLEALLTLVFEINQNDGARRPYKQVQLYLSLGVLKKLGGWIDLLHRKEAKKKTPLKSINVLDPEMNQGQAVKIQGTLIKVRPMPAVHNEIIAFKYSTGLIFQLFEDTTSKKPVRTIGITSDTGWQKKIESHYQSCDLLVLHLGGLYKCEFKPDQKHYDNHLGVRGCCELLFNLDYRLALISEWGEELKGYRRELLETIARRLPHEKSMLCADIGTVVDLARETLSMVCEQRGCDDPAEPVDVFEEHGIVRHYCLEHLPHPYQIKRAKTTPLPGS
jgi:glyoxylase-like metal-dependent hydrolase (beta-lactamase superfamily II)